MIIISDAAGMARAIATTLNPWLRHMLALRRVQLLEADIEVCPFLVIEPGDTLADIEQAAGIPIATTFVDNIAFPDPEYVPSWEWCRSDHGWHEIAFVLSDDGGGAILFVPEREGIDPTLLAIIHAHGEPENADRP